MWNFVYCYLSGRHDFGMWCEPGAIFLRAGAYPGGITIRRSGLILSGYPGETAVIRGGGRDAKIWLEPEVSIADSYGFNPRELSNIIRIVLENRDLLLRAWHDRFSY